MINIITLFSFFHFNRIRWDKPEKHIMAALESRLKESKESSDRAIRDRKLANQREKDLLQERERVIDENKVRNFHFLMTTV